MTFIPRTLLLVAILFGAACGMDPEVPAAKVSSTKTPSLTLANELLHGGLFLTLDVISRGCIAKDRRTLLDAVLALARSCVVRVGADRVACGLTSEPNVRTSGYLSTLVRAGVYAWIDVSGPNPIRAVPTVLAIVFQESLIAILEGWKAEKRLMRLGRKFVNRWTQREDQLCAQVNPVAED